MLYLSAIILAFFLSFILVTKRDKSAGDFILLAWLLIIGTHLFTFYLLFTAELNYPNFIWMGFALPLAHGPLLYLYTRQQTSLKAFDRNQLLHFIPVLLSYLLFLKFFLLSPDEKIEILKHKGKGFEIQSRINITAIYLSGVVYTILSLVRLLKYRTNMIHQFSNVEKINFSWLLYLIVWLIGIWIVVLFVGGDRMIFGSVAIFVLWLGYFGIKQVRIFSHENYKTLTTILPLEEIKNQTDKSPEEALRIDLPGYTENPENSKYLRSSLTENEINSIHVRLMQLLDTEKPFKNPDLILNELAQRLEVHPNHLSQVINSKEKKNFYDLINQKRIEEFTNLISKPSNKQYTLLALAFDCGFNSKASFNRNFKKHMGLTPSDYLKANLAA